MMMLRGNLRQARRSFLAAYELEPTNPLILSSLELLNSSYRLALRHSVLMPTKRVSQFASMRRLLSSDGLPETLNF